MVLVIIYNELLLTNKRYILVKKKVVSVLKLFILKKKKQKSFSKVNHHLREYKILSLSYLLTWLQQQASRDNIFYDCTAEFESQYPIALPLMGFLGIFRFPEYHSFNIVNVQPFP